MTFFLWCICQRLLLNNHLDTTVLCAACLVIVANDWLACANALRRDLACGNTLAYEILLSSLSTLLRKGLVDCVATYIVGVADDLNRCIAVTLNVLCYLVKGSLSFVAQYSRTEFEVATVSTVAALQVASLIEMLIEVLASLGELFVDLLDLILLTRDDILDSNTIDAVSVIPYNAIILGICILAMIVSFSLSTTLTQFAWAYLGVSVLQGLLSWLTWRSVKNPDTKDDRQGQ